MAKNFGLCNIFCDYTTAANYYDLLNKDLFISFLVTPFEAVQSVIHGKEFGTPLQRVPVRSYQNILAIIAEEAYTCIALDLGESGTIHAAGICVQPCSIEST